MVERLEVSPRWLSRYMNLAKLPKQIVHAFASIRNIKERHAPDLQPMLAEPKTTGKILTEADRVAAKHHAGREGRGAFKGGAEVMIALKKAARPEPEKRKVDNNVKTYKRDFHDAGITVRTKGGQFQVEIDNPSSKASVLAAFQKFIDAEF